ncbi:MAG: hypothetical protein K8U57_26590 [Planctomycetes bacterium]|nr:hypothetical protein [Planctomycetota bacterium]
MFSPVACSACSKPFQVPEASLGKPTVCPWCQATVLALPVGAPAISPTPPTAPAPLSLDDAPARAPVRPPAPPAVRMPARSPRNQLWWALAGCAAVFALVIAAVFTTAVLRQKQGHGLSWEWQTFTPSDKSFSIDMLGQPVEDKEVGADEKRYVAEGWYSGTTVWIGWRDLTQIQVQLAGSKDAWQHVSKDLFNPERDRLKNRYGGALTKDATTKFEDPLTHEVRLEYPGGRVVERMLVMPNGPRPRVYYIGMAGKFDIESPEVQRLFDSFRVTE